MTLHHSPSPEPCRRAPGQDCSDHRPRPSGPCLVNQMEYVVRTSCSSVLIGPNSLTKRMTCVLLKNRSNGFGFEDFDSTVACSLLLVFASFKFSLFSGLLSQMGPIRVGEKKTREERMPTPAVDANGGKRWIGQNNRCICLSATARRRSHYV